MIKKEKKRKRKQEWLKNWYIFVRLDRSTDTTHDYIDFLPFLAFLSLSFSLLLYFWNDSYFYHDRGRVQKLIHTCYKIYHLFSFTMYPLRFSRLCWFIGWKTIIDENREGPKAKGQYVSRALFNTHRRSCNNFVPFDFCFSL